LAGDYFRKTIINPPHEATKCLVPARIADKGFN
jgi:hypothetical protein